MKRLQLQPTIWNCCLAKNIVKPNIEITGAEKAYAGVSSSIEADNTSDIPLLIFQTGAEDCLNDVYRVASYVV